MAVNKQVNKLQGHSARVGALAWNGDVLSSGSRDRLILQRDTRTPSKFLSLSSKKFTAVFIIK